MGLPETQCSGILNEAISITPCEKKRATHFVLCHRGKIKFLINLKQGIFHLRRTIAVYNKKLSILLRLLPFIPKTILKVTKLGYYAHADLHSEIMNFIPKDSLWNVFIGSYDSAQKIVTQCYKPNKRDTSIFIKIGNAGSDLQMQREIDFLRIGRQYSTFRIPELLEYALLREGARFNIQVTNEFKGKRISPKLTNQLLRVTEEIAGPTIIKNGVPYTFSHGDFAPWNIRHSKNNYIVYDWEHCGLRPKGYDAIYFIIMSEIALKQATFNEAFEYATNQIKLVMPSFIMNKELFFKEFSRTIKTLKF